MTISTAELTGVFIAGVEVGVLFCLILQRVSQRRREQDHACRQLQREIESLRCDLRSLCPDFDRLLQRRSSPPSNPVPKGP